MTSTTHLELGQMGEKLVAHWLQGRGWSIVARRWHCPWGELDLIASRPISQRKGSEVLAFIEVKTRNHHNWDLNGLLAITPKKQDKLFKTASLFLAENPELEQFNCRFDVALVQIVQDKTITHRTDEQSKSVQGLTITYGDYSLHLYQYIESAFDTL